MKKLTLLACALSLTGVAAAAAQGTDESNRGFVSANVGIQVGSRTLTENSSFSLYDETGFVEGSRKVANVPVIDVAAGLRIRGRLFAGLGYSRVAKHGDASLTAFVPHPLFTDRLRPIALGGDDLEHSQQGVHLMALYQMPLVGKIDLLVGGGPSVFFVSETFPADLTATETSEPYDDVTLAFDAGSRSKTGVGFNVAADLNYPLSAKLGAGLLVRYSYASVNMPLAGGASRKTTVGGLQVGAGLRFRF